jgi:GTP-binding protein
VVLTKADKPKPSELAAVQAKVKSDVAKHPAAYPEMLTTSARMGSGIPELRTAIASVASNFVVS